MISWPSNRYENMKIRIILLSISLLFFFDIVSTSAAEELSRWEIPTDLVKLLIKDIEKVGPIESDVLEDLNENLECELYDLNCDGVPEYFLCINSHFWCGAGGFNCNCWIFQKTSKGYRLLLDNTVIRVQDSVTAGYRDLTSELDSGWNGENDAREIDVTVYRFDGKKYRPGRKHVGFRPFGQ